MSFSRRGGARVGAGRPRKHDRGVTHDQRPSRTGREAVHVTLRVLEHVHNLRTRRCFEVVFAAMIACCNRECFRVVGLTVQGNHLHLLVEAASAEALTRGIQAISVRIARGLNGLMGRRGSVFERFHARRLENPSQVRAAMAYILRNTAKHAAEVGRRLPPGYVDPYTAGYFGSRVLLPAGTAAMVVEPQTWLLRAGWRLGTVLPLEQGRSARANHVTSRVPRVVSQDGRAARGAHAASRSPPTTGTDSCLSSTFAPRDRGRGPLESTSCVGTR